VRISRFAENGQKRQSVRAWFVGVFRRGACGRASEYLSAEASCGASFRAVFIRGLAPLILVRFIIGGVTWLFADFGLSATATQLITFSGLP
jgi:hypothetical protein